jgi:hypothetical protein
MEAPAFIREEGNSISLFLAIGLLLIQREVASVGMATPN